MWVNVWLLVRLSRIFYQLHNPKTVLMLLHSDKPQRYSKHKNMSLVCLHINVSLKPSGFWYAAECVKRWVLEAWAGCSHKKIVAASAVTAFWNLSSLKTRLFTGNFPENVLFRLKLSNCDYFPKNINNLDLWNSELWGVFKIIAPLFLANRDTVFG